MWKTQDVLAQHAARMLGCIDGCVVVPLPTITEGTSNTARQID
jgi:hypothetical protein